MTDQEEKKSTAAADDGSTQPNSPALSKREGDYGPLGKILAPENAVPDAATVVVAAAAAANTQPKEVDIEASRQISRHGSGTIQPVKVPRSNRRGLFGRLTILAEVEDPKLYPRGTKWFITFVVAIAGIAAPLGSTIIFGEDLLPIMPKTQANCLSCEASLSQIATDFGTTPTVTNLAVSLFLLSMAIFPLWWSSFSERFGRRTIYLLSFSLFVLGSVLAAVSTNISMLVVMRLLEGAAASSVQGELGVSKHSVKHVSEIKIIKG